MGDHAGRAIVGVPGGRAPRESAGPQCASSDGRNAAICDVSRAPRDTLLCGARNSGLRLWSRTAIGGAWAKRVCGLEKSDGLRRDLCTGRVGIAPTLISPMALGRLESGIVAREASKGGRRKWRTYPTFPPSITQGQ